VTNVTPGGTAREEDRRDHREEADSVRTNFINPLYITNDGRRVIAEGPIDWEGGTGQCSIAATITQGNVQGSGDTGNYNQGDPSWECNCDVQGSGRFQPGPARAHGVISGTSNPPPAPWPDQTVELVLQSERVVVAGAIEGAAPA
jgi:hypothetical protein